MAGSSLCKSQFRVRRWQVDFAGRRRPVGADSCVAARDKSLSESIGAGADRVDTADTGGHEFVPEGSPDDRSAGFTVIALTHAMMRHDQTLTEIDATIATRKKTRPPTSIRQKKCKTEK